MTMSSVNFSDRLFIAALALAASCCSQDEGLAAERRYEMVRRHGTLKEQCEAITEVADTYLRLRNEEEYALWSLMARNNCKAAEMRHRLGM